MDLTSVEYFGNEEVNMLLTRLWIYRFSPGTCYMALAFLVTRVIWLKLCSMSIMSFHYMLVSETHSQYYNHIFSGFIRYSPEVWVISAKAAYESPPDPRNHLSNYTTFHETLSWFPKKHITLSRKLCQRTCLAAKPTLTAQPQASAPASNTMISAIIAGKRLKEKNRNTLDTPFTVRSGVSAKIAWRPGGSSLSQTHGTRFEQSCPSSRKKVISKFTCALIAEFAQGSVASRYAIWNIGCATNVPSMDCTERIKIPAASLKYVLEFTGNKDSFNHWLVLQMWKAPLWGPDEYRTRDAKFPLVLCRLPWERR